MRTGVRTAVMVGLVLVAAGWLTPGVVAAQTPSDALPRTADGRPDFSGIWQALSPAHWNIEDHSASKDVPGGQGVVEGGEIPYLPEALAQRDANFANRATADPDSNCYLPGVPRIMYMPFPFQIIQAPDYIAMAFEYVHGVRHIFFDSEHPPGPIEWWMGDARARWEDDTLVVDLVHFNDETWFDAAGNFHSTEMHLVERYTLIDRDHINYEVTVEDPQVFSRPWTMTVPLYRRIESNVQVLDYICQALDFTG